MVSQLFQYMKIKFNKKYILYLALVIGTILRLYKLDVVPPHLTPDEAALGYNAYSISQTARDEYGQLLPIIFKSFGDYKPGFYIYTAVPFVSILGLNEWSVRLPSAIGGIISIWLVYEITKWFVKKYKLKDYDLLPSLSALVLATNPWHIHFSRGAWEVNLSLTFTLVAIYFFLLFLNKNKKYLIASAIFFGLTLITYQGAKLSSMLVLAILVVLYYRDIVKNLDTKTYVLSLLIGLLIAMPIVLGMLQGKSGRLTVFSVFSYPRSDEYIENFIGESGVKRDSLVYNMYYSKSLNFFRGIMGRYYNHFSARFLFFEGDWANPKHTAPYHGTLLLSSSIFLLSGLIYIFRSKFNKYHLFILVWLILAPLPSVLSRDQVHAVRALNLLIPLSFTIAIGINYLIKNKWGLIISIFVYICALTYFLESYFIQLPYLTSQKWDYGYKQIVETVWPLKDEYEEIRVQQSFAQPYIYFLFYTKYDPATYQKEANLIPSEYQYDVGKVEKLGDKLVFGPIDWSVNRGDTHTLFVADEIRIPSQDIDPKEHEIIKEIYYLDNIYLAFRIIKVKDINNINEE